MRRTIINKEKTAKICGFMGKPCVQGNCAIYYSRFGRCSVELLLDNLYRATGAMANLAEAIVPLMKLLSRLNKILSRMTK